MTASNGPAVAECGRAKKPSYSRRRLQSTTEGVGEREVRACGSSFFDGRAAKMSGGESPQTQSAAHVAWLGFATRRRPRELGSLFLEPFVAGAPVFRPSRTFFHRALFLCGPPFGTALHSPFARRKLRLGRLSPRR